jgi:transcriptional regulator with XRE-family HTH domain
MSDNVLKEYLDNNNIKHREFAKLIGISESMLSYILDNKRRPSEKVAKRIEKITNKEIGIASIRNINYISNSYKQYTSNGNIIPLHHKIWIEHNGAILDNHIIHHIDGNTENNNINNLEMMTKSDHKRIHNGWIRNKDGEWTHKPCSKCKKIKSLKEYYNYSYAINSICKKCNIKYQTEYRKENKEKVNEYRNMYSKIKRYGVNFENIKNPFKKYLLQNNIKIKEFSKICGIHPVTLGRCANGICNTERVALAIEKHTNGKVKAVEIMFGGTK